MIGIEGSGGIIRPTRGIIRRGGAAKIIRAFDFTSTMPSGAALSRASAGPRVNASGGWVSEAVNAPRFDYDPVSLASLGLLIEPARTNCLTYSENFTNVIWGKGSAPFAILATNSVAPDGTSTASTVMLTSNNIATIDMYQRVFGKPPGATLYAEAYVKLGTATNFALTVNNQAAWNTSNGKTFTVADGLNSATWTKVVLPFTVPASGNLNLSIGKHGQSGQTQQTDGTVIIWGFQITEAPGSYIPTTSAFVTVAAETLTIPLADGVWDIAATDPAGTVTSRISKYDGAGIYSVTPRAGQNHVKSLKASLVRRYATGLDTDAMSWFGAQAITDPAMQTKYLNFTRLCKTLTPTIWSNLMVVSCRDGEGYLNSYGGGIFAHPLQLRGAFKEAGVVTKSASGAAIAYGANWGNRIETPLGYVHDTHKVEPNFIGLVYRNNSSASPYFTNNTDFIHWNAGTTSSYLATFSGGDANNPAFHTGISAQGIEGGNYIASNPGANNSYHVPQFFGVDMMNARKSIVQVSQNEIATVTHATVAPSTSASTGLFFYPGILSSGITSGSLHYLVFIAGGIVGKEELMKKFSNILSSTLLSDLTPEKKHFHLIQGGQSLSTGTLERQIQKRLNILSHRHTGASHSYGGTPIANWVGANPSAPVRGSQYTGGWFHPAGTAACQRGYPAGIDTLEKWVVWLQGESDAQAATQAESLVYQQQLTNLWAFLQADYGTDLKIVINNLDYTIGFRTSTTSGNLVVSGMTGASAAVNGTWPITAVIPVVDAVDSPHLR